MKCLIGGLLTFIPVLHFFALGYMVQLARRAKHGRPFDLPEWDDWRDLFRDGVFFFVILLALAGVLLLVGWILSQPLKAIAGPVGYLPLIPALVMSPPLCAAALYRYLARNDLRDAFDIRLLLLMLQATRGRFFVPTFCLLGLLFAGFPLLPFAVFMGGILFFYYCAALFYFLETQR